MDNNSGYGISDEQILTYLREGNQDGVELFMAKYEALLINVISRTLKKYSAVEREEAFFDAFEKIMKSILIYRKDNGVNFRNWICMIAKRTAIDRLRKLQKQDDSIGYHQVELKPDIRGMYGFDYIIYEKNKPINKIIWHEFEHLPLNTQELLTALCMNRISPTQYAEMTGTNPATIRSQKLRALKKLQDALLKYPEFKMYV